MHGPPQALAEEQWAAANERLDATGPDAVRSAECASVPLLRKPRGVSGSSAVEKRGATREARLLQPPLLVPAVGSAMCSPLRFYQQGLRKRFSRWEGRSFHLWYTLRSRIRCMRAGLETLASIYLEGVVAVPGEFAGLRQASPVRAEHTRVSYIRGKREAKSVGFNLSGLRGPRCKRALGRPITTGS